MAGLAMATVTYKTLPILTHGGVRGERARARARARTRRKGVPVVVSKATTSSERKWQRQYADAVEDNNLDKALSLLESVPSDTVSPFSLTSSSGRLMLDACVNISDITLLSRTYHFLHNMGALPTFGKYKDFVSEGPKNVTPEVLEASTGLEATRFAPKKWGLSGASVPILLGLFAGISLLANSGADLRPKLAAILGLTLLDATFLGGAAIAQITSLWPPYRRRILVHEAGHVLAAYLLGCPIRGVILDPLQAMQCGVQGQAGTQFWDETLAKEFSEGKLDSISFDRYCMVIFAGIAAEALVYGETEGGEDDENLFRGIVSGHQPPWPISRMSNQVRWAVQQSYALLKQNRSAHKAAFQALQKNGSLGFIIRKIEEAMSTD